MCSCCLQNTEVTPTEVTPLSPIPLWNMPSTTHLGQGQVLQASQAAQVRCSCLCHAAATDLQAAQPGELAALGRGAEEQRKWMFSNRQQRCATLGLLCCTPGCSAMQPRRMVAQGAGGVHAKSTTSPT